mgnify:CR=1 FL=1
MVNFFAKDPQVKNHSFFADWWNVLDFCIVTTGWLPYIFPATANYNSLRAIRALRPLRTVPHLPSLKRQIRTIFDALPRLADVFILIGFIVLVFGILGVQLFHEGLHYRCFPESGPGADTPVDIQYGVCRHNPAVHVTAPQWGACGTGEVCRFYDHNPAFGELNFDHFAGAALTIFQCISGEGWSDFMYTSMKGFGPVARIYFVLLVVMGNFYVMNLFLAVLWQVRSPPYTYYTSWPSSGSHAASAQCAVRSAQ